MLRSPIDSAPKQGLTPRQFAEKAEAKASVDIAKTFMLLVQVNAKNRKLEQETDSKFSVVFRQ